MLPGTSELWLVGGEIQLVWDSEENLAGWLVHYSSSAPVDSLPRLLEMEAGWALEFSRLPDDFNIHADVDSY